MDNSGRNVVVDAGNDRVQLFDSAGNFLYKFGSNGSGNGEFNLPIDIAIDYSGRIFVLDALNNRVQVFGTFFGTSVEDKNIISPSKISLNQNYPNPFNSTTSISYQLPNQAFVNLSIHNTSGQLIEKLVNEQKNAGYHSVE